MEQVFEILPEQVRQALSQLTESERGRLEEIRLRVGSPVSVLSGGRERILSLHGNPIPTTVSMLQRTVASASGNSLYAVEDQLREGFRTLPGGHRLGICGTAVMDRQGLETITKFSSLDLRIAKQILGAAEPAFNLLYSHPGSTLIVGSPGSGKTTVLRDLIRILSDRLRYRVGVVDERGEIAACLDGQPQFALGRMTDVLSGTSKQIGIYLLLRSMNPEWIALDEISAEGDVTAILQASYCGVRFVATAHAWQRSDLERRPLYRKLMEQRVFENLICIDADRRLHCERIVHE